MVFLFTYTLLIFGLILVTHVRGVQVWMDDSTLEFSGEGGNEGATWMPADEYTDEICDGGVRVTEKEGAQVTLEFNGTSLSIYFLADHRGGNASVYLDDLPPDEVNTFRKDAGVFDCDVVHYLAPSIQDGYHTVTVKKTSGAGNSIFVHGFQYTPCDGISSNAPTLPIGITSPISSLNETSSNSLFSSSSSSLFPTAAAVTTASSASPTQSVADSKSSINVRAIAGGVLGGSILLLFVTAAVIVCVVRDQIRVEPYILDTHPHTVDDSLDPQSPDSAEGALQTSFTYQYVPQADRSSFASSPASSRPSSLIPQPPTLPMTVQEKMQLRPSRPILSTSLATTSVARTTELMEGQAVGSGQLDVVRTLLDRNVPGETISIVIDLMVAGQPVPHTIMEGLDLRQVAPSNGPPPQYSAGAERP